MIGLTSVNGASLTTDQAEKLDSIYNRVSGEQAQQLEAIYDKIIAEPEIEAYDFMAYEQITRIPVQIGSKYLIIALSYGINNNSYYPVTISSGGRIVNESVQCCGNTWIRGAQGAYTKAFIVEATKSTLEFSGSYNSNSMSFLAMKLGSE